MNILTELDNSIAWEREEAFSIEIEASEMIPKNFNSVDAMREMILRLQER